MFIFQPQVIEYNPNLVVLIDGDVVAYQAAYGKDKRPEHIVDGEIDYLIKRIQDDTEAGAKIIYLTGTNNFRNDVACLQQYKGNRYNPDGTRKRPQPKHLLYAKKYLISKYNAEWQDKQEADDALSIAQTMFNDAAKNGSKFRSIISTIDKDLMICPGLHHNIGSQELETVSCFGTLSLKEKKKQIVKDGVKQFKVTRKVTGTGLKFFYAQLLMGDSTDNIPGLPKATEFMVNTFGVRRGGCGAITAYKVLYDAKTVYELFSRVFRCYQSYWRDEPKPEHKKPVHWKTGKPISRDPVERLEEQGQLLWMRTKQNELWKCPEVLLKKFNEENKNE